MEAGSDYTEAPFRGRARINERRAFADAKESQGSVTRSKARPGCLRPTRSALLDELGGQVFTVGDNA